MYQTVYFSMTGTQEQIEAFLAYVRFFGPVHTVPIGNGLLRLDIPHCAYMGDVTDNDPEDEFFCDHFAAGDFPPEELGPDDEFVAIMDEIYGQLACGMIQ